MSWRMAKRLSPFGMTPLGGSLSDIHSTNLRGCSIGNGSLLFGFVVVLLLACKLFCCFEVWFVIVVLASILLARAADRVITGIL